MSVPTLAFFNNKGGVGKTSLLYHVAWMLEHLKVNVVCCDLDPQANLSSFFLSDDRLEQMWQSDSTETIFECIRPILKGTGDIAEPRVERISDHLALLAGDLALSRFEDELSLQWPSCVDRKESAFRVVTAFWRIAQKAAEATGADLLLIDLGPNLGAINRSALIASDFVVIPLGPDLFSLQALRNVGPTMREWREQWTERQSRNPEPGLALPAGSMRPIGYVLLQHTERLDRPVKAYGRWIARIPETFACEVRQSNSWPADVASDPDCLALLKHYRSLMPMGQEARKPVFDLKPADGAIGAHGQAVRNAWSDFRHLTEKIYARVFPDRSLADRA
ncbi:ParA family protein [bacterium CPR1]|nr:ParA family protein [bacterium CPR1]